MTHICKPPPSRERRLSAAALSFPAMKADFLAEDPEFLHIQSLRYYAVP